MAVGQCWYSYEDLHRYYQENRDNPYATDPARMNCWVDPSHPGGTDPEHRQDGRWRYCRECQVSWYAGLVDIS